MLECPLWHPGLLYATVDIDRQRIPRHYGLILTYSWRMGEIDYLAPQGRSKGQWGLSPHVT